MLLSIQFILGRAGTGKSTYCLTQIIEENIKDPLGPPLILLVPEQSTHQIEMNLAQASGLGGIMRSQVLSFRRLGWRVFSETGGGNKTILGDLGKRMLLRRLLLKYRPQLQIFARSATRPGMADILTQLISEFKTYRISPQDLLKIEDSNFVLTQKLQELALLYNAFNQALGHDVLDPDDELGIVAKKIPLSPSLQKATIWIDGFKDFTPVELHVIEYLIKTVQKTYITLPLDPNCICRFDSFSSTRKGHDEQRIFQPGEEVFTVPWKTYQKLIQLARSSSIQILSSIILEKPLRFKNPQLNFLEKNYFSYPTKSFNAGSSVEKEGLQIISAVNRRAEVEAVAQELRQLARKEGLRWSNMAVITRDLSAYQEIVKHVFNAFDLPFFLDSKRPILHHPLLELLQSFIEIVKSNWAYEPLFRALKTGFFPLSQDSLDRLENYCLANGIHGKAWTSGKEWNFPLHWNLDHQKSSSQSENEILTLLNQSRQTVLTALQPFIKNITLIQAQNPIESQLTDDQNSNDQDQENLINVRNLTEVLYNFLLELHVPDTLEHWAVEARETGNLAEARLQEQIWEAVINVFDEMITGLGEENLELQDYALILASGLENLKLGLIPPGLDQIMVGSLDRSRNPEVKVLFLIGANEGILPARPEPDGVLDSEEREHLEQLGLSLAPKGKAQLFEEHFYIYTALTLATNRLYVTYSLTDEEGKALSVSPVITRLRVLFPNINEKYVNNVDDDIDKISHPRPLLPSYASHLMQIRQGKALSPLWQAVQTWYQNNREYHQEAMLLEKGIYAENREEKIPVRLARRLYGKRLLTSVSRLEQFSRCPFAHYSKYGLKLQERSIYQLASLDMGQFFHAVLHEFAQKIREENLDWGNLSKQESWEIVNYLAEKIAPQLQNQILLSSARYRYLKHKLKRTVHHAIRVLGEHARSGKFIPIQMEVPFGPGKLLPGIEIPLREGNSLLLRGQIDRIDAAALDGQVYLRILDYKSRQSHVSLNHIFYGLDLQLLAYLDAALQGAEVLLTGLKDIVDDKSLIASTVTVNPAGFLYFPVVEPLIDSKTLLTEDELDAQKLKGVKVKGFLLADRQVLEAMDQSLTSGQSDLLGLKLTKDMEFRKNSNVLTDEQFEQLREHLHAYLQRSGEEIMSGNIAISPYRQGQENACQYCKFKPLCHFDVLLTENRYRDLPVLKEPEVWNLINNQEKHIVSKPSQAPDLLWLGEEESNFVEEGENLE